MALPALKGKDMMNEDRSILDAFERARGSGIGAALATIVKITGSSYRRPGAKMLITEDGEISGAVSGGCLERDLIQRARCAIDRSEPRLVRYDTRADGDDENESLIQSAGPGCEGIIDIFINPAPDEHLKSLECAHRGHRSIEYSMTLPDGTEFREILAPPMSLIIFGAGHDAVPVARLARELGWETTVVDGRSSFPMPKRLFSGVNLFISCNPDQLLERVRITPGSIILLMTHNYGHDLLILRQIIGFPAKYIGLLGPRSRGERLLSELQNENIPLPLERLYFPVGLDIGGETPQAIALAFLAEAQAVLSGRKGGFLRERQGSIHG